MKYKFNIGDRVRVLNGQNIPHYTGDWCSEMNQYINLNAVIKEQCDVYDPYPSYKLQFVDYVADLYYPSNMFIWDERGLELINSAPLCNTSTKVKDNTNAIADRINKDEIAAFARDLQAMCDSWDGHCEYCPLGDVESWNCKGEVLGPNFDIEGAVAAIESYRERKRKHRKPCPEVIDKALDIYTIKVMVERNSRDYVVATSLPVQALAHCAVNKLKYWYSDFEIDATVRLLSARRFTPDTGSEIIDVYTIEIEAIKNACAVKEYTAMDFAQSAMHELLYHYEQIGKTAFVDVLSAKRFVLKSHKEYNEE